MRLLQSSFFQILLVNVCLFIISSLFVKHYYSIGLPYYDSVGSYVNMFSIANTTEQLGLIEGVKHASEYSLSYLQSFFAVLTAPLLPKAPEWMIVLNFLTLFIAQWSIYIYAKNMGFSVKKAYLLSFLPLIPGIASGWEGGYIDMRRDSTFFTLLIALFFGLCDYMRKPQLTKGIIVGIILGLTLWSRGNALAYILSVITAILLVFAFKNIRLLLKATLPLFVGTLFSLPFYIISWKAIYDKYVFGSWGIGQPRIPAVMTFLRMTPIMFLGPQRNTLLLNSIFFLVLGCILYFLIRKRILLIHKSWYKKKVAVNLFIAGVLVYLFVLILNALILGIGGYIFPNFPAVVGIFAIVIYFVGGIKVNKKVNHTFIVIGLVSWTVVILLLNSFRMHVSMPPAQSILLQQTKKAASDLDPILGGKVVSYFWLDHINVHDLNFYITQKGGVPINATSGLSRQADTEMPPDKTKSISQQQEDYALAIRSREYIVVSEDLDMYENSNGFFFILKHGKPVVNQLFKDPNIERIYSFKAGKIPFIVLHNKKVK